jgi:phage terminase large subunit-like protein
MATGFITPMQAAPTGAKPIGSVHTVNTRVSLWADRWPAIALQECIDEVEAAPDEEKSKVKYDLPCHDCPAASRCLNSKRKELGPLLYDREIMTKPRSQESTLFNMELMGPLLRADRSFVPYWHKPFSMEHKWKVVQAWDLAWSEKIGGDYLVCMTGAVNLDDGQRMLLDLQRWQRISFDEQVKLITAKWQSFNADAVIIESDAAQSIWSKHIGRNTAVPVKPHSAGGKRDLQSGVPSLLIMLENQKWEFPYERGSLRHDEMENFLAELEAFGWVDGKLEGVGEHDDTVMCWWHLNYGLNLFSSNTHKDGVHTQRAGVVPGARA